MSTQDPTPKQLAAWLSSASLTDVDRFGVPVDAFGLGIPQEFFEVIGRLVAVNGRLEYLKDRLDHLPPSETDGIRKFEQFTSRYESGRQDRHTIVHSSWLQGADTEDPEVILGMRYKMRRVASNEVATLSIRDVPGSEREHEYVQHTLVTLRKLLKRDIDTMHIGMSALTEVGLAWAVKKADSNYSDPPSND